MLLVEALKQKNRLGAKVADLSKRINDNNRRVAGNEIQYDVTQLINELGVCTSELISIKSRIQRTNAPMQEKIFEMAELRSQINMYKKLNCSGGKQVSRGYGDSGVVEYEVQLTEVMKDAMISNLQKSLDDIQTEVDTFNFTTELVD